MTMLAKLWKVGARLVGAALLAGAVITGSASAATSVNRDFAKPTTHRPTAHNHAVGARVGATLGPRATLTAYNNQYFITCGNGCITGAELNYFNGLMLGYAGMVGDTNVWTAANSWSGVSNFTGTFEVAGYAMTFPNTPATLLYAGEPLTSTGVFTALSSSTATPTVGAVGAIATTATAGHLFDGSSASPHSAFTPSFAITRWEDMNSNTFGGTSPALWVETVSNNTGTGNPNGNAIEAVATQYGEGDEVGVVGWGTYSGPGFHTAYGGFFNATNTTIGGGYAIETFTGNNTGSDAGLSFSYDPYFVGAHLWTGGNNLDTTALWISPTTGGTSQWDAGIYVSAGAAKSFGFADVSSSVSSLYLGGSHSYGINGHDGTFSTDFIIGPSSTFLVTAAGAETASAMTDTGLSTQGAVCNSSAGLLSTTTTGCTNFVQSVAAGGTGDTGTAWTPFTPTITATSGTFTTTSAAGRYKTIGKTVFVEFEVTITTVGTASGIVVATLPMTAATTASGYGYVLAGQRANDDASLTAAVNSNATAANISLYTGATAIGAGNILIISGVYESS